MGLKIYGVPRSRAIRTLWMVQELGIPYELVEVAPGAEGSGKAEYLSRNPTGAVPWIEDDGMVLWESLAINLYLSKKYPSALGPKDVAEDGRMAMWGFWSAIEIEPRAAAAMYNTSVLPPNERNPAAASSALEALKRPLQILEKALRNGGGFLVGGRFTVADLNAVTCVFYLRFTPQALADKPAIRAWYDAAMARPANRVAFAMRGD
ncbi:MAG: glutathione S-transferase family protein [Hyphomicrobiales bacterium]